jgi:hypothetical protein
MLAAVACVALLTLPIQPALQTPSLFQASVILPVIAFLGWFVTDLMNDCAHSRHGLLPPQRKRVVVLIAVVGTTLAAARLIHLICLHDMASAMERLQRLVVGLPYFVSVFLGLDM